VTVLLQSSTATAMMTTSLAAAGLMELVPALAAMLGANVGTALIVKLLSFDVFWIAPLLLIAGYIAFRKHGGESSTISGASALGWDSCCSRCTSL
jgi:phosphate:Na+ symporter